MREIKFRGKDEWGNWREGDLIWATLGQGQKPMILDAFDEIDIGNNLYEVAPESVGQFTGLTDADGREIYEGDVIKLDDEVYAVTWDNYSGCWSVEFGGMGLALLTQYSTKNSTIIGNAHDNPNLMEAAHD